MKIDSKRIIAFFKSLPRKVAIHSFLVFLILFILSLGIGGLVFYRYNIQKETLEVEYVRRSVRFREDKYKKVLEHWREMERNLANIESCEYNNPFLGKVSLPPTSTVTSTVSTSSITTNQEPPQKKTQPSPEIQKLLRARTIFEFYSIKGQRAPSLWQRAIMWEEKGLGLRDEYKGTSYQNALLLKKLKEELTQ